MYEIENFCHFRCTDLVPPQFTGGYVFFRPHIQLLTSTGRDYVLLPTGARSLNVLSRARPDLFGGVSYDDPNPLPLLPYVLRAALYGMEYNAKLIGYIAEQGATVLLQDVRDAIRDGRHQ